MTDSGFRKLEVCAFLQCSPSELAKRCPELTDESQISAYLNRKHELEYEAWERVKK